MTVAVDPDSAAAGLLSGLRVIDAATMVMVPSAALVMADYGAEVIKVEALSGDANRFGHLIPGMPDHQRDYCFFQDNRNKKSLAIDLKHPDGLALFYRLVETADVFFTNLRARALDALRIDYASLRERNGRLIYAHGTGYGDAGPEACKPGYDAVCYWSRSGLEHSMFPLDGWLGPIPYGSGDHPSGMSLFAAVMMALYRRERTGEGSRVSTSLIANGAWSNATVIQARLLDATFHERRPRERPLNFAAVYYVAGCGRKFKFTIIEHQKKWPALCRCIGREDLIDHPRYATVEARARVTGELVSLFDRQFAERPLDDWKGRFEESDVPFSILSDYDDVASDEQMRANGVFVEIEDELLGRVRSVNSPLVLEHDPPVRPRRAPHVGEHTREILAALGEPEESIEDLIRRGVVGGGPTRP
ncbi:MAG TPA: CoA transferase [Thermoanaerobaculia bacterium]|nr:CoA transferase [Thermoanaerobaculia bacterium]